MSNNKITIKDVAKEANVSVATVSRVMNNKGYVYDDTRKVVLEAVEKLGFEPNQLARSLSNHKSNMIGVVVPHLRTTFYADLIEGIEIAAMNSGYKTMLFNTQDDKKRELEYLKICEQYSVDGLIVASNYQNVEELINSEIPVVSIDHILKEDIPSITSNNSKGGQLAAQKFNQTGVKNVLLLRGPSFLITSIERTKGFIETIDQNTNVIIKDYDLLNPDENDIITTLKNNPQIDAIFALSDSLALVAIKCLQKLNKRIPEDVQVIGYDDAPFAKDLNPSLSTISQAVSTIGEVTFNALLKLINDEDVGENHKLVDVKFISRESTK